MQITENRREGVLVVVPVGRVDSTTAASLEQALVGAIGRGERRLVVDFGGVDYISSAGLRALLIAARRVKESKGAWVLSSLGEPVRQVFELAGFLPLFTVESTAERAVARLAAAV